MFSFPECSSSGKLFNSLLQTKHSACLILWEILCHFFPHFHNGSAELMSIEILHIVFFITILV